MPANTAQRYREFARNTQDESPASDGSPSPWPRTMSYFAAVGIRPSARQVSACNPGAAV